jgi:hypothetical protein
LFSRKFDSQCFTSRGFFVNNSTISEWIETGTSCISEEGLRGKSFFGGTTYVPAGEPNLRNAGMDAYSVNLHLRIKIGRDKLKYRVSANPADRIGNQPKVATIYSSLRSRLYLYHNAVGSWEDFLRGSPSVISETVGPAGSPTAHTMLANTRPYACCTHPLLPSTRAFLPSGLAHWTH